MNEKFPSLLTYIFFGMTALVCVFRIWRTKEWTVLSTKMLSTAWKPLLLGVVPIAFLMWLGNYASFGTPTGAIYFAASALITCLLSQIGLSGEIRSFVLLAAAVGLTLLVPPEFAQPVVGTIGGMVVWKLIENLLHKPESRLDDVTAPIVWLTAFYWSRTGLSDHASLVCQEVVLATLTVSMLIRFVQPVLIPNDTIYLKRVMLSCTGGLALLILVTKVMMEANMQNIAILGGAGFLVTYLLQSLEKNVDDSPNLARGLKNILLIGIATLAASRLFGMEGLLVLAATTVVAPVPGAALIGGLFWAARVLMQGFVFQYNPNVTGVNLMHYYVSAAMYAGFLVAVVSSLFIKDMKDRRVLTALIIASLVLIPAASSYFMHPEPTSSFLISLGVGTVLLSMLAPAIFPNYAADQENLILMPTLASAVALASHELIEFGDGATNQDRMIGLCAIGAVALVIALVCRAASSTNNGQKKLPPPSDPVELTSGY